MLANFQSSGITAVLNDFLKIIANGIHVIHAVSVKTLLQSIWPYTEDGVAT